MSDIGHSELDTNKNTHISEMINLLYHCVSDIGHSEPDTQKIHLYQK